MASTRFSIKLRAVWFGLPVLVLCCLAASLCAAAEPPKSLSWSVEPPVTPWNLGQGRWAEFVVTTAENSTIKSLTLSHSTMIDSDAGRGVQLSIDHFRLCTAKDINKCNTVLPLEAGKRATLWLTVDDDFAVQGTFKGNLYLDAAPLTEPKTLALTIQQTTPTAKTNGVLTILLGVAVAWFITIFSRGRIARDQALLPIAVLRQKLTALQETLRSIPAALSDSIPIVSKKLADQIKDLETSNLDNLQVLPPTVPGWTQSTTQVSAYQTFMQLRVQIADNLDVLVSGIETAAGRITPSLPADRLAALKTIVQTIDQLAGTLPQTSDTLRTKIQALFYEWNAQGVRAQGVGGFAESLALADSPVRSVYSIRMEIQSITMMFWLVWGTLSVLAGSAALVIFSPGFGTAADYIRCLLWGFGLPVAGNGLQQLTMSSLNTQLGVTLPK